MTIDFIPDEEEAFGFVPDEEPVSSTPAVPARGVSDPAPADVPPVIDFIPDPEPTQATGSTLLAIDEETRFQNLRDQSNRILDAQLGRWGSALAPYTVDVGEQGTSPIPEHVKPGEVFMSVTPGSQDLSGASFFERTKGGIQAIKKADFLSRVPSNSLFAQSKGLPELGEQAFPIPETGGEDLTRWQSAKNAAAESAARMIGDTIAGGGTLDTLLYSSLNRPELAAVGEQRTEAGKRFSQAAAEQYPTNPAFQSEILANKLPAALGSALPFAATGTLGGFLGPASSSLLGGLSQARAEYKEAVANGADPEQAKNAALVGVLGGASEGVLGIGRTGVRGVGSLVHAGGEESLQEIFQGWLSSVNKAVNTPRDQYDSRERMQEIADVMEQGAVAFLLGSGIALPGTISERLQERARKRALAEQAARLDDAGLPRTAAAILQSAEQTGTTQAPPVEEVGTTAPPTPRDLPGGVGGQEQIAPPALEGAPIEAPRAAAPAPQEGAPVLTIIGADTLGAAQPLPPSVLSAPAVDGAGTDQAAPPAPEPEAQATTAATPPAPKTFSEQIQELANAAPDDARFGPNKVYVHKLHGLWKKATGDTTTDLAGFKAKLLSARSAGEIGLTRADMPQFLNPQDLSASSISQGSETYNFVTAKQEAPKAPVATDQTQDSGQVIGEFGMSTSGTSVPQASATGAAVRTSTPQQAASTDLAARPSTSAALPRIAVDPVRGGGAKSPYQILEDFAAAIGKTVRVRRLGKRFLGVYRPGSTLTAERFAGDIDTAAHELAGHWLDDKHGIVKTWYTNRARSPYDTELSQFWPHGSVASSGPRSTLRYKRAEGVAEFVRAYIVNPAAAKAVAPQFAAYFERQVPPDTLQAIRSFSEDVRRWAGEDPVRRASLNIRMNPPTLRERLWSAATGRGFGFEVLTSDRLRMWFSDPYWYAVKAFRGAAAMRGKTTPATLRPSENFELLARLLASHDSRMSDQLERGLVPLRPAQKPNAKGELEVERSIDPQTKEPMTLKWLLGAFDTSSRDAMLEDMREASGAMVAERTLERARLIDAEAAAAIAALDPANPRYGQKVAKIQNDAARRKAHVSGLGAGMMSDVTAAQQTLQGLAADPAKEAKLKEAARRYRLWADLNIQMLVDSGRLSNEAAAAIRNANEFYVDMHRLSEEFEQGNRQQRGGKIGTTKDVVKRFKGSTLEINNVYENLLEQTDSIQKEAQRNMTMRAFTEMLTEVRDMHQGAPKDLDQFGSIAASEDQNTIRVFRDGKAEYWKFDDDVRDSLKGLGELGSHAFIDLLSIPSRVTRYLITHSPGFVARNTIRDTMHRSVIGTEGSRPWDVLRGYSKDELSRYNIFGGGQFGNYIRDRNTWNRELKRVVKEMAKDPGNIILYPLKLGKVWQAWEHVAEASEKLGRIAEFRNAFKRGKEEFGYDDYEAALFAAGEARGLIDFAQAGTVMRAINRLVPFSNARVRGLTRTLEVASKDPRAFALRWGVHILMPTLLVLAWNRMDDEAWEEYQQQPAYLRDFFWSFKVGSMWIRIPKPHELGVLAGGVERAVSGILGEKHASEGYGHSAADALLPFSNPTEAQGLMELLGPLKVPVELTTNRDTFRDRDIVPYWERDLKLSLREGQKFASLAGQRLADVLQFAGMMADARQIDYVLNSYGGLGSMITSFSNERRDAKESTLKATGFVVEPPSVAARDVQWLMDWAKENGKERSSDFKAFKELRTKTLEQKTAEARDAKARELRRKATQMREKIERTGKL